MDSYVDKKDVKKGSLLTHMRPAINPPKMIDDPSDSKPEDWVEEETIIDTTVRSCYIVRFIQPYRLLTQSGRHNHKTIFHINRMACMGLFPS